MYIHHCINFSAIGYTMNILMITRTRLNHLIRKSKYSLPKVINNYLTYYFYQKIICKKLCEYGTVFFVEYEKYDYYVTKNQKTDPSMLGYVVNRRLTNRTE